MKARTKHYKAVRLYILTSAVNCLINKPLCSLLGRIPFLSAEFLRGGGGISSRSGDSRLKVSSAKIKSVGVTIQYSNLFLPEMKVSIDEKGCGSARCLKLSLTLKLKKMCLIGTLMWHQGDITETTYVTSRCNWVYLFDKDIFLSRECLKPNYVS